MTFHSPLLRAFTPKQLFRAGEKGVWYDPSDMSTLWQDSARTTAVTAVEQPVGCIDDKSGNGFNATQSTSASRPVLSARYNLLTKTEQFDDAYWGKTGVTITANSDVAPDGTTTADTVTCQGVTNYHAVEMASPVTAVTGVTYTISIYVKKDAGASARRYFGFGFSPSISNYAGAGFDIDTLTATATSAGAGYSSTSPSITSIGDGWYKATVTVTCGATSQYVGFYVRNTAFSSGFFGQSYAGVNTQKIIIWGADLRVSNDGVGIPAYQRVNTSTDYDTAGFPMYLRADGTDDSLATGSIDFSGTDAVTVWAGVRKLSDADRGTVVELTASAASNNGSFHLTAPNAASATYAFESKGSALTDAVASTSVAAPITNVLCAYSDISLDQNILRVNGTQADSDVGDQGTGNFSNAALYIGRRGGSSLPFNGRIYGLVVRGASSTTGEITDMENWLNGRARAY